MAGLSLKCGDCGILLRSVEEAQEHAELTKHSDFSESTEAVLNLVCSTCGKPCRSKTESDLHTKRTGHTKFEDKTLEVAKPISLEAEKDRNMEDAQGESSSSSQPQEMVVPEVDQKLLEELEGMGFPKARAIRALHYSGSELARRKKRKRSVWKGRERRRGFGWVRNFLKRNGLRKTMKEND
ncbi:hypothetical protein CsSME_00020341 [Camellia sinensis var. sinensis]